MGKLRVLIVLDSFYLVVCSVDTFALKNVGHASSAVSPGGLGAAVGPLSYWFCLVHSSGLTWKEH